MRLRIRLAPVESWVGEYLELDQYLTPNQIYIIGGRKFKMTSLVGGVACAFEPVL